MVEIAHLKDLHISHFTTMLEVNGEHNVVPLVCTLYLDHTLVEGMSTGSIKFSRSGFINKPVKENQTLNKICQVIKNQQMKTMELHNRQYFKAYIKLLLV